MDGDLFDLRCNCGITVPSTNFKMDIPEIVHSLHFLIYSVKAELDQLKDGLETLSLLSAMQAHPHEYFPSLSPTTSLN